jgi:hypothetical protein
MYARLSKTEPFSKALFFFSLVNIMFLVSMSCSGAGNAMDDTAARHELDHPTNGKLTATSNGTLVVRELPPLIEVKPLYRNIIDVVPAQNEMNKIIQALGYLFDPIKFKDAIEKAAREDQQPWFDIDGERFRKVLVERAWNAATAENSPLAKILGRLNQRVKGTTPLIIQFEEREKLLRELYLELNELYAKGYTELSRMRLEVQSRDEQILEFKRDGEAKDSRISELTSAVEESERTNSQLRSGADESRRAIDELTNAKKTMESEIAAYLQVDNENKETIKQLNQEVLGHKATIASQGETIRQLNQEALGHKATIREQAEALRKKVIADRPDNLLVPVNEGRDAEYGQRDTDPLIHEHRTSSGWKYHWITYPIAMFVPAALVGLSWFLYAKFGK